MSPAPWNDQASNIQPRVARSQVRSTRPRSSAANASAKGIAKLT